MNSEPKLQNTEREPCLKQSLNPLLWIQKEVRLNKWKPHCGGGGDSLRDLTSDEF